MAYYVVAVSRKIYGMKMIVADSLDQAVEIARTDQNIELINQEFQGDTPFSVGEVDPNTKQVKQWVEIPN